jgi:hypothetical protein
MTIDEIERVATARPESERKLLAASLIESLSPPAYDVSDE